MKDSTKQGHVEFEPSLSHRDILFALCVRPILYFWTYAIPHCLSCIKINKSSHQASEGSQVKQGMVQIKLIVFRSTVSAPHS